MRLTIESLSRMLGLELVRVTELAALRAYRGFGLGKKKQVDAWASDAIRHQWPLLPLCGTVVIGEGIKDNAPGIFKGEILGDQSLNDFTMAVALDPIDGTTLVAEGIPGAISVVLVAICDQAQNPFELMQDIPSYYMRKLAVGPEALHGPYDLDLNAPTDIIIHHVARNLSKETRDMTVVILKRPRHETLIQEVRATGARIRQIGDGDIAGAIAPSLPGSQVDMYIGIGGSPEAVIAAGAIKCRGGGFWAQMSPRDDAELQTLRDQDVTDADLSRIYTAHNLVPAKHILFAATGISDSDMLKGVKQTSTNLITESILLRSNSTTVRPIYGLHDKFHKTARGDQGIEVLVDQV